MAAFLDSIKQSPEKARKSGLKADNMWVPAGRNNQNKPDNILLKEILNGLE